MQFPVRSRRFSLFAGLFLLWAVLPLVCGCNPRVMHSMIAPETGHIQVWRLDLGMDALASDTSLGMAQIRKEFTSELANEQYYRSFLGQVSAKLGSLGHQMATGEATEGTILIKPGAQKRRQIVMGSLNDQRLIVWNRMENEEAPAEDNRSQPGHSHEPRPVNYVKPVFKQSDAVRNVYIEITDMNGRLLGTIDISGGKVKPEFVAKVIDRLIREGKW